MLLFVKYTTSNDWIGCSFKPFRGHRFINLFSVLEKNIILLFERNKPIIKFLLKDIPKPYKYGSSVKVDGISDGILWNSIWQMPLMFTITRRNCHQYPANLIFVRYITCDNLMQSRIQSLFYIKLTINNSGFLYCGGNKFQLMLIFPDEFNKRTEFWLNSIWSIDKNFIS